MDLDIEMGDNPELDMDTHVTKVSHDHDILPDEPDEPGEIVEDEPNQNITDNSPISNKIHISGVDTLHTDDIKSYVRDNFGSADKIEWVNDSSANIVFSSGHVAREAIVALSAIDIADATALPLGEQIPAKPFDSKPELSLAIRFALESDKKQPGAALRSRYYLLNPEHDPEEKRRRQQESRSRYRNRDGDHRRSSHRSRYERDESPETFEATMYDDAPRPSGPDNNYANENKGKELFGNRQAGRTRSASPSRDGGRSTAMDYASTSSRNRANARSIKDSISTINQSKELFPSKSASSRVGQLDKLEDAIGSAHLRDEDMPRVMASANASGGDFSIKGSADRQVGGDTGFSIKGAASAKELFPDRLGGGNTGKELFDNSRTKQRQKAQDLFG